MSFADILGFVVVGIPFLVVMWIFIFICIKNMFSDE